MTKFEKTTLVIAKIVFTLLVITLIAKILNILL